MIPLGAQKDIQHPLAFSSTWQILGPFQIGTRGMVNYIFLHLYWHLLIVF